MNPSPGAHRGRKILYSLFLAVAFALGGLWLWIKAVERQRWAEMGVQLAHLEDEAASRSRERPALHGDTLPGNAWQDYDRALKSMKALGTNFTLISSRDVLEKQAPTLEAIRRGVRHANGSRKIDWRTPENRSAMPAQYLVHLVVSQARVWAGEGRARDAAQLLLDGSRLASDIGSNADLIGGLLSNASQVLVLDELKGIVLTGALSADDLRDIARTLDVLDREFPKFGDILVNGAMCAGWDMRRADSIGDYLKFYEALYPQGMPRVWTWRFAFSERMMMKDAFERELEWSRRIALADARSWDDASRITREVDGERGASTNGIPRIAGRWLSGEGYYSLSASFRERRAQLRLLRAAAQFRATGEILELDDPFDGKLIHRAKEGRLRIWSVGRNAVDDRGSGEKDIVLEVTR